MTDTPPADPFSGALKWAGLALLLWLVYLIVLPFLIPLGWACVLATVSYPFHERLLRRWTPAAAAAFTTVAVTLVVIVPAVLTATAFFREALDLAARVQTALSEGRFNWLNDAWLRLQDRLPFTSKIDLEAVGAEWLKGSGAFLMRTSGSIFQNVTEFVIDVVLALFAMFFLLRDADAIMRSVRLLLPMDAGRREQLIAQTRELIRAGVISWVMVAALQGVLGGLSLAAVGFSAPVFWGVVIAISCLLPFGAWVVWLPAAIVLATSGAIVRAIILAALGLLVVSTVDNILRPMLLSERAQINGLVIFVSLLGGLSVFGLLGLVLGPVLVVTALGFLNGHVNNSVSRT
ncbi:MAG TPA: AI-2E family transporter [Vicinamibacterales bacterium]|nr:AI-2E family transporter [Vicinamibacterales bacterium]